MSSLPSASDVKSLLNGVNLMGNYGGFYKGDKKKLKRERLEKQAEKIRHIQQLPKVEIIGKKGK